MANIRIKDQTTDTALVAGDYVIVDNETEGTRKFDLGQKLVDIDDDITDVKSDLSNNSNDLILFGNQQNTTHNSTTFTWLDKNTCKVLCSASTHSASICNIYYSSSALPAGIKEGKTYYLKFSSTSTSNNRAVCTVLIWVSGTLTVQEDYIRDTEITIPENATGFAIRLRLYANYTTDETVTIKFLSAKTNQELGELIDANTESIIANTEIINGTEKINVFDVDSLKLAETGTSNGITFTWNEDKTECAVSGTSTGTAFNNIINAMYEFPSWIEQGASIFVDVDVPDKVTLAIMERTDGGEWTYNYMSSSRWFTFAKDTNQFIIRLVVFSGNTVDGTAKVHITTGTKNSTLSGAIINLGKTKYKCQDITDNGIAYTWDRRFKCHAVGTASANSSNFVFSSPSALPDRVKANDTVVVMFSTSSEHLACRFIFYLGDGNRSYSSYIVGSQMLKIPSNCIGLSIYLTVTNGFVVDDYCSLPYIVSSDYAHEVIPYKPKKPLMVSIIDDDTETDELVRKFYQNCKHNGVVGAFAVCTKQYMDGTSTIADLLNYQNDGFNMIPHCYEQKTYLNPSSEDYDIVATRANYFRCVKEFTELGLVNAQNSWVVPYGSRDELTANIAKDIGFSSAFIVDGTTLNYLHEKNIYGLHRCGLQPLSLITDDTDPTVGGSVARCKLRIDNLVNSEMGGWLIFVTHFNTWQSETYDTTLDNNGYEVGYSRFNEVVQYALESGCNVVSVAQGLSYMKPIIDRNFTMG